MWLGSLPFGEANVVALRYRLQDLMFGPGHFDEFMAGSIIRLHLYVPLRLGRLGDVHGILIALALPAPA